MTDHPALEELAAVAAGESDDATEDHVRSCPACASAVSAVEQTVADLKSLPQPEPDESDREAWREALRRKGRRPQPATWRWVTAAGGVAAVLVAFMAFSGGGEGVTFSATDGPREEAGGEFTPASIRALLVPRDEETAGLSRKGVASPPAGPAAEGDLSDQSLKDGSYEQRPTPSSPADCEPALWAGEAHPVATVYKGTWEERPVWVLVYRLQDEARAWVVGRADCSVHHYARQQL